jgi:hypothetical protein
MTVPSPQGQSPAAPLTPTPTTTASYYAAATQSLRTTARWLLTAAAGVGGLLVAGLQLSDLGALGSHEWPRLLAALLAVASALGAIGYMVWNTSTLLTDDWITLGQLHIEQFNQILRIKPTNREERSRWAVMKEITDGLVMYKDELYGDVADDVSDLSKKLSQANATARVDQAKRGEVEPLRAAANAVVQYANFRRTRRDFTQLRQRLGWGSIVVVLGVATYAYTANPPKKPTPTVTIIGVTPASSFSAPNPTPTGNPTPRPNQTPTPNPSRTR